jgi:adenine-specific DNA-methyltransferase
MGSKRSLAPRIADIISDRHPGAIVADAFAGTCAVGTAVASRHRVYANDIHAFAEVIARTLLVTSARVPLPNEAWEELRPAYDRNLRALEALVASRLGEEERVLARVKRQGGWRALKDFAMRELSSPVPITLAQPTNRRATSHPNQRRLPYSLFSSYFASAYFGVRQAAEIDSIRYAIDKVDAKRRDIYLFALLHAASFCAAAPGHFAQFLIPRDENNTLYVARIRKRSVIDYFNEALLGFWRPRCADRRRNKVFRSNATDFLTGLKSVRATRRSQLVVYADPPYSRAQYSRYYHVLETLVLYDYPAATGKGRYRHGRFETGFSRKSEVCSAMSEFVEAAAETGAALYLSYPKNGLLYQAGNDVLTLLKKHFRTATIVASVDLNHSTMGGAPGTASIHVMEDIYYAEQ